MQILVLHDGALAGLVGILKQSGHDVRVVKDADAAKAALARQKADIAVVASTATSNAVSAVARALSPPDDATYRSVIAFVMEDTPSAREAAYGAGADDVVTARASAEEIADHVRSAERIVRLERGLRERVAELESALRRLAMHAMARGRDIASGAAKAPSPGGLGFLLTSAWTGLDYVLEKVCTEYLQASFTQLVGAAAPAGGLRGARIALNDVDNELQLQISFYATEESSRAIATAFCGGDTTLVDDDIIRDVLLELANSAMGAVKSAFLGEEFRFAGAIPEGVPSAVVPTKQLEGAEAKRVFAFRSDNAVVYAIVTLRHQGRIRVPGIRLREGMVVASDVLNDTGMLLVRAGTRLTETTAEKLRRLLPKREIELADAA